MYPVFGIGGETRNCVKTGCDVIGMLLCCVAVNTHRTHFTAVSLSLRIVCFAHPSLLPIIGTVYCLSVLYMERSTETTIQTLSHETTPGIAII